MAKSTIRFLGTGTAFHTDGRGSQALWFEPSGGRPFLVDLGPTVLAAIARFKVDTPPLSRLFVTHLHGDHVGGWPFLLLHLNFIDRREAPLEVVGPVGLRDCLEGLMRWSYRDVLDGDKLGFPVEYREVSVEAHRGLTSENVHFDVLPMEHHPSSIGYRFELDGAKIAVSGDTAWCDNLEALARESDLLIVECTDVEPGPHPHVSLRELRERRSTLGSCRIVLVHLPDAVAAALATDPIPGVTAGYDGMDLEL